jgi:hypothetical protein
MEVNNYGNISLNVGFIQRTIKFSYQSYIYSSYSETNFIIGGDFMPNIFDMLLSFKEASQLWNLDDSTLRKAVASGKLVDGQDVKKFGKQWVITIEAMERTYGKQPNKK